MQSAEPLCAAGGGVRIGPKQRKALPHKGKPSIAPKPAQLHATSPDSHSLLRTRMKLSRLLTESVCYFFFFAVFFAAAFFLVVFFAAFFLATFFLVVFLATFFFAAFFLAITLLLQVDQ